MHINGTLRKIIPICSLLLALGTVAFQTIENTEKKEELLKEKQQQIINNEVAAQKVVLEKK